MPTEVDDFLAHFGVLGMHWGVRKERESIPEDRPKGLTPNQKKALIAGGIAVGVGAAAAAIILGKPRLIANLAAKKSGDILVKDLKNNPDTSILIDKGSRHIANMIDKDVHIPTGTTFHRVASQMETGVKGPKYATYLAKDVAEYRSKFDSPFAKYGAQQFKTKFETLTPSKIAGNESMVRSATDLLSRNSKMNGKMRAEIISDYKGAYNYDFMKNKFGTASNEEVVKRWLGLQAGGAWKSPMANKFMSELRTQGYSGMTDHIDSAGLTQHAVVLINNSMVKTTGSALTDADRKAAQALLAKLAK